MKPQASDPTLQERVDRAPCPICGKPVEGHENWGSAASYGYLAGFICPEAPEGSTNIVVIGAPPA